MVSQLDYFHDSFEDVIDVCDVFSPYMNQDGAFLVRNSTKRPGVLTLSVMHAKKVNHFNIIQGTTKEGKLQYGLYNTFFTSIPDLVAYYRRADIPNRDQVKHIRLTRPVLNVNRMIDDDIQVQEQDKIRPVLLPRQVSQPEASGTQHEEFLQALPRRSKTVEEKSRVGLDIPILPNEPIPKKSIGSKFKNVFSIGKKKDDVVNPNLAGPRVQQQAEQPDPMRDRPPARLPPAAVVECPYSAPSNLQSAVGPTYLYDSPRDVDRDMTPVLVDQLRQEESEMCHCGISIHDSELPNGWSVHRSQEAQTAGRLFYVSPENVTTWNLPQDIISQLTLRQKTILHRLNQKKPGARVYGDPLNV